MKCIRCGAEIPDNQLICPGCGQEIQIVPDYNPLDDVLTAQVRGAVSGTFPKDRRANVDSQRVRGGTRTGDGRTGVVRTNTGRTNTGRTGTGKMNSRPSNGRTGYLSPEENRQRQKKLERKKQLARKKKKRRLIIIILMLLAAVVIGILCYFNSYAGKLNRGYRLLEKGEYGRAEACFEKAISKNKKRGEAYGGLADICLAKNDVESGEQIFLNAIKDQPSNTEIYRKAIQFYIDTDQKMKVSVLLDGCSSERVLTELQEYISETPEYSLDETKEYEEIQALELTGTGSAIYYTTDGTDPTESSTKYTEPIRLDEGKTEVRAISVNAKGIPSLVEKKTYTIEFPIEAAPSVTPSTGSYDTPQTIVVVVPENYEAYYTTDGSEPDPSSASTRKYTGPIDMPEGNTTFKVVLANKKGRLSDVTIRKYELILSE